MIDAVLGVLFVAVLVVGIFMFHLHILDRE